MKANLEYSAGRSDNFCWHSLRKARWRHCLLMLLLDVEHVDIYLFYVNNCGNKIQYSRQQKLCHNPMLADVVTRHGRKEKMFHLRQQK